MVLRDILTAFRRFETANNMVPAGALYVDSGHSTRGTGWGLFALIFERYVFKVAPHEPLNQFPETLWLSIKKLEVHRAKGANPNYPEFAPHGLTETGKWSRWTGRVSFRQIFEEYVTKFAPCNPL